MKQFSTKKNTENSHGKKQFLKLNLLVIFALFIGTTTTNGQVTNTAGFVAANPAVTINQAAAQADPTNTAPINFTVVFDQPVTGFTTGDIVISGTAGATTAVVVGGPITFNVAISGMTACGTVIATIPAGVCTNVALEPNLASTSTDNTVNVTLPAPNVFINQAASQPDPASAGPINFTVIFEQAVTGFATGDVTLSGTAGATTATVTGSGYLYNIAVSGMTASGTVVATIAAGVAVNGCALPNNASTSTDNTVTVTCVPPVVNVTPTVSCGPAPNGTGPCNPLTASGNADIYIWSPFAGLYYDCTLALPYTGANASTVYAALISNTTFTVTGTILATGCTASATALVNYTPPAPVVTPPSVNMCLGDPPVKLRILSGNGVSQFCSGTVNIAVPDNNPAGAFSTINVSGISPVCVINEVSVRINMPHTKIGNMVFVLKAPNGQVINLDYYLTATGGSGASTGFSNTNFSSLGTVGLSAGVNPYTAVFRADLVNSNGSGQYGPSGPTGMASTATNWSSLFSVINGNWTLGFYDGITGDVGTLTSWCLSFNTTCTTLPATPASWSPIAGLFTNALGTIPYTGNAVDSVWVKPTPAGVYTYQVTTSGTPPGVPVCTSMPRTVVVTVAQPVSITSQPANATVCAGATASFSAAVTGTGPISYTWQESTGGGIFTNIVNGGRYSGVNTATLTIAPVIPAMNGYLYRVIINSGAGCSGATSSAAILTVGVLPTVTITANPLVLGPGEKTTIRSTVSPNPAATYTWYYNGSVLPGANADTLVVDLSGLGDYYLMVTDINGCTNISNSITIAHSFSFNLFTYPNPSAGIFQVRYYSQVNAVNKRTLVVFDNQGHSILTKNFTQTIPYQQIDVDVRANGKGIYWVELRNAAGRRLAMNRVVVQ